MRTQNIYSFFLVFTRLYYSSASDNATESLAAPDWGIFRADYLSIGHVRTDPIITQNCLSDHVHTFYGPPLLYPKVTDEELRNFNPDLSSGNIRENNSLYWHPSVYRVEDDGTRTLLEPYWTDVYYTYETNGKTKAFPNGFKMIAGYEDGDTSIDCENPKPCNRQNCKRINKFFPKNRCEEIKISMAFPRCWDGVSLDSENHRSHVVYPMDDDAPFEGKCPNSHPVRLPFLEIDIRYRKYKGGPHEFSDGSGQFHTDYMSGWDEDFLQSVIDNCNQKASEELCTKVPFTWRDDIIDPFDEEKLVELLYANPVPNARTNCITNEAVTNIDKLPRGTCSGIVFDEGGGNDECRLDDDSPTPNPPTPTPPMPTPPTIPSCQDSSLKFKQGKKFRKCNWVTKKKCRSKSHASHCPSRCDRCDEFECVDSRKIIRVWSDEHDEIITGKCQDLVNEDSSLCAKMAFAKTCRKQCGYCNSMRSNIFNLHLSD